MQVFMLFYSLGSLTDAEVSTRSPTAILQALATACVFLATKMDSTYHSLMNITHVSYRALREKQARPFDQEYFNQDGVSVLCSSMSANPAQFLNTLIAAWWEL